MGKGTVADWHKQQRKKELQKNKESRLAVRNEKVLAEKTVASVRKEVERLEHGNGGKQQNHTTQMKIDRLKKELKLLEEKEAEDRKNRVHKKIYHAKLPSFEPLAKPAMSVYYDERFNPYGEPPPGQPRLFHKRGGGTTLRLEEACVRGEEVEETAKEQPQSAEGAKKLEPRAVGSSSASSDALLNKTAPNAAQQQSSSTSRKSKQQKSTTERKKVPQSKSAPQRFDPSQIPDLPPPSAAVKRSRGAVDIWASEVEEDYNAAAATHWYYTDTSGHPQGPFTTEQMKGWNNFFPPDTPVRPISSMEWRPMHTVKELRVKKQKVASSSSKVDRIAALRGETSTSDTIADRIAALRGDSMAPAATSLDDKVLQDRVAALRSDLMSDSGLHGRLAALRGDINKTGLDEEGGDAIPDRIAALKSQLQQPTEDTVEDEVASRIAELRAMKAADNNGSPPAPHAETTDEVSKPTPKDSNVTSAPVSSSVSSSSLPLPPPSTGSTEIPPSLPLPPPPLAMYAQSIPPSMPLPPPLMGPTDVPPAFPMPPPSTVTNIPPAYPMPPLPTADVPPAFPMPSLPTEESTNSVAPPCTLNDLLPKKKKAKVDKSLVAFVPSHLLRNKR